jgi:hypothetical protein
MLFVTTNNTTITGKTLLHALKSEEEQGKQQSELK